MVPLVCSICLAAGLLNAHQTPDRPRLQLSASATEPFVGQEVDLTLTLRLSDSLTNDVLSGKTHARLEIPWLTAHMVDWSLPAEQWVCRLVHAPGLPCRLDGYPSPISLERAMLLDGQPGYRLHWRFRMKASSQPITLEPVRLHIGDQTAVCEPLTFAVRELPSNAPAGLFLGVGDFQVEASIDRREIALGEETVLALKVLGLGDQSNLDSLPWPDLSAVEAYRRAFLIEPGTESWNARKTTRLFRYRLKPRRPIDAVPALAYVCFDPRLGVYQSRVTSSVSLTVRLAEARESEPPYPTGLFPDRLRLSPAGPELLSDEPTWPGPVVLALALIVPPLGTGLVWVMRHRLFPGAWPVAARHWSSLAVETMARIESAARQDNRRAAELLDGAVLDYLRRRFHSPFLTPTDAELRSHLERVGVAQSAIDALLAFRSSGDAARFAPFAGPESEKLRRLAANVLRELEATA